MTALQGEMGRSQLFDAFDLKDRRHFAGPYFPPGLDGGMVKMTLPNSLRSKTRRYRMTILGRQTRESRQDAKGY